MDTLKNVDLYEVELQYMQGLGSPDFRDGVTHRFSRADLPFDADIRYIEGARPIDISCDSMHYMKGAEKLSFDRFIAVQLSNIATWIKEGYILSFVIMPVTARILECALKR